MIRFRGKDLLDPVQSALPLLHDLRLEGPITVSWDLDLNVPARLGQHRFRARPVPHVRALTILRVPVLLVTEMLGELLVQSRLEHVLREELQQPVRARQRQALLFR